MPKGTGPQIVAAVLGLIFVIVLIFVGRTIGVELKNRFLAQKREKTTNLHITPTPGLNELVGFTPTPKQNSGDVIAGVSMRTSETKGAVGQIPATGSEILIFSSFLIPAGYYLRIRS